MAVERSALRISTPSRKKLAGGASLTLLVPTGTEVRIVVALKGCIGSVVVAVGHHNGQVQALVLSL